MIDCRLRQTGTMYIINAVSECRLRQSRVMYRMNVVTDCRLRQTSVMYMMNVEIQLLLKQGQVEVEAGPFVRDLANSFLINRLVVEKLNRHITVSNIYY